jgi:hypothetical protein
MTAESKSDGHDGDDGDYEDMITNTMIMVTMKSCVASGFGFVESFLFSASVYSSSRGREDRASQNKFPHDFKVG